MRLAVVLATLAATAGLTYRAYQDELALREIATATRHTLDVADQIIATTGELRAALHAYIAPGRAAQFGLSRSGDLLAQLQASLAGLTTSAGAETPLAADAMAKLVTAEKRARGFARDNQELLAADIVFTDAPDHLDAIRLQAAAARDGAIAGGEARERALRREQYVLLGVMLGAWLLCALMLVPLPVTEPAPAALAAHTAAPIDELPIAPVPIPAPAPEPVVVRMPPPPPVPRLPETAQLCGELARVADGAQIATLLTRAADVLDATGLIVWVASADGSELTPAASCGYDERMLARVGSLPRTSENLTAAAFRDGARRTSGARSGAPAALAVPLIGPSGAIGVLSGEIRHVERVGETTSALASILAAQLATLVGSMPPADTTGDAGDAADAADAAPQPAEG